MDDTDRRDINPAIAELLDDAFVVPVDVETAARHLWVIHSEAARLADSTDVGGAPDVSTLRPGRRRIPRAAVPVLALVMMMSSSGVAVAASQTSLPGDVLYPVKRGTERAQLVFVRDPVTRAQLQLSFARTRLDEIEQIAATRPQHVPGLVEEIAVTLVEVEHAAPEVAAQVQPVSEQIRRETTESIASLELPDDVGEAVVIAMTATPTVEETSTSNTATPVMSSSAATTTGPTVPAQTPTATPSPSPTTSSQLGDVLAEIPGGATPTPTPTPTPTSTGQPSAGDGSGSGGTDSSDGEEPGTIIIQPETDTADPGAQPTSSEGGTGSEEPQPVVTARPQPAEDGGGSRADDDDAPAADDGTGTDAPKEPEESSTEPVDATAEPTPTPQDAPYTPRGRPGDTAS